MWHLQFAVYNTLYGDLKYICSVNFPLFSLVHVLVQVFIKPMILNLLGYNISVRVKYGPECRALWCRNKTMLGGNWKRNLI